MHLFYQPEITSGHLNEDESRHAVGVLRLDVGDHIELTDGKGSLSLALITEKTSKEISYKIESNQMQVKRNYQLHLAIAPTKQADRIEWLVEKSVELGVDQISFVRCKTSERKEINIDRLQKIVISAMKQSRQAWMPELHAMEPFDRFLSATYGGQNFIGFVDNQNPDQLVHLAKSGLDTAILIGPEGDFTGDEVALAKSKGWKMVSLGPSRLRTETAGLAAVMTIHLINA